MPHPVPDDWSITRSRDDDGSGGNNIQCIAREEWEEVFCHWRILIKMVHMISIRQPASPIYDYAAGIQREGNIHITCTCRFRNLQAALQHLTVAFLLLLFHFYNVVGRNTLQDTNLILNHLDNVTADIALDDDLVQPL